MGNSGGLDYVSMGLGLTAGLMLFLLGVGMMADGLKAVAGDRMKSILARFTSNRLAGVATGAAVTTVLDSSSATTIMVVGLVDAGLLELSQALGVILGANIGTTVSSQLIASDIMQYAPLALLVGFLMRSLTKGETWPQVGAIVLGLGLVFFGLDQMEEATRPLQDHEPFLALMHRMENPLLGVAAGAVFTAVIASSSAMLGIIIVMAGNGAITLPAGLALMMGAEIGTCADTLLATAGRSRAAVRAGVFQLIFNVSSVLLWIAFTRQMAQIATSITPGDDIKRQIANAHVLFNVSSVLVFLPFIRTASALVERLIPDGKGPDHEQTEGQE